MYKIIKKSNSLIDNILSTSELSLNDLRLNDFCLKFNIGKDYLLFNGITGEILLISENLTKNDEDYMFSHHYFVSKDYDEYRLINELRTSINLIKQASIKGINNYTVLTTSDCNARCFYCYEKGITKAHMNETVASDVSNYIMNHSDSKRNVDLTWFGGEPLLNTKAIDIITSNLKNNEYKYSSTIITNGYLINDSLINRIINEWNVKKIQITLDGTKDIYNKTKNYINDDNPFDKVINNIETLINNKINVSIRLNLTRNNFVDLKELIDLLYRKFENNKYYKVYIGLLYEDEKNLDIVDDLYEKKIYLQEHLHELSIFDNKIDLDLKCNNCIADDLNSIVILPDGSLASCEHVQDENRWGTIYSNQTKCSKCYKNNNEILSPIEYFKQIDDSFDDCHKCFNYPRCINLKNCPSNSKHCTELMRKEILMKLEWKIKDYYLNK